ncbi:hypothetical protein [Gloeocapsa sp. PCC 73106]|uniref:hypothetical protein n=1 Tax=Gloeocapsa sp. PCC 73106 TaxID=102232 RepID=UPI0002ABA6C3|nr:hypothetical protein [Gloeocapsa sp. PCC 73106]ELR98015.1 hypothetical protein GLO73106DRAFT_00018360 [Gloeocapsa sp. PCC 73106]
MTNNRWEALFNKNWTAISISILGTSIVFGLCTIGVWKFSDYKANHWGKNLRYFNKLSENYNDSSIAYEDTNQNIQEYFKEYQGNEFKKKRIIEQLTTISNRAKTHLRVAKDIYVWSVPILSISTLASIVTGICLLEITRRGWENASVWVIGIFVTSSGILAFGTAIPLLFNYEQNIKIHTQLYVNYVNLEDTILSILAAKNSFDFQPLTPSDSEDENLSQLKNEVILDKLIVFIDNSMQQLHSLNYEINLRGVPTLEEINDNINPPQ